MNKWKEVANLFDLELNEEFKMNEDGIIFDGIWLFNEEGLMFLTKDGKLLEENSEILMDLCKGKYTIEKNWKSKMNDDYWYYSVFIQTVGKKKWISEEFDYAMWKIGNCFKTKEEAETKGKEIMEQIKKVYEES